MAKRGRKPKHHINWGDMESIWRSIFALGMLAVGVISLISIVSGFGNDSGKLNSLLKIYLIEGLGLLSILFPFWTIYFSILIIGTFKFKYLSYKYFGIFSFLYFCLLGLLGSIAGTSGELVQGFVSKYISMPGAVVLFIVLILITFVLLTNKGIDKWIAGIFTLIQKLMENVLKIKPQHELEGREITVDVDTNTDFRKLPGMQDPAYQQNIFDASATEFESPKVMQMSGNKQREVEIISPPSSPILDENGDFVVSVGNASRSANIETVASSSKLSGIPFSNKLWEHPPLELLSAIPNQTANAGDVHERARKIEETLYSFGIKAQVQSYSIGPSVTQYAISIPQGSKANKIVSLATDIALRIKSPSGSVRIEAPIPGSDLIGIEVPNYSPATVSLKSVLESPAMKNAKGKLTVAIGLDVSGKPVIEDMTKWPHALIAGATGSGKSVMINAIVSSLLFRCSPQEVKFIMIDPKMVEMIQYGGIPHLLCPVITDIEQKAVSALAWAVSEMDQRYREFSSIGVRNIEAYNALSGFQAKPYIIIVADEIADMMMVASSDVERYITRLAQKSRATGIHLVLATQRPSVNVLTGTIKANIPTRLAFKVTSNIDSRVIIDQIGAETLIGRGDMLFVPPLDSKPKRVQGVFVSDEEIKSLVNYLRNTGVEPEYKEEILEQKVASISSFSGSSEGLEDSKMVDAITLAVETGTVSSSFLQRKMSLGYSRAARIVDDMQAAGIVGFQNGSKPREGFINNIDEAVEKLREYYKAREKGESASGSI